MIDVTFNEGDWSKQLDELVVLGGLSSGAAVTSAARIWLRAAVRLTVPSGPGQAMNNTGAQKKLGVGLTVKDVRSLFSDWKDVRDAMRDEKFKGGIDRVVKSGKLEEAKKMLKGANFNIRDVINSPKVSLHRSIMNRRGHVPKRSDRYIVVNSGAVKQYQDAQVEKVGAAKAGWIPASMALKVKLPAWVKRHKGNGTFKSQMTGPTPWIIFSNDVPHANANARADKVMHYSEIFARKQFVKMLQVYWSAAFKNPAALKAKLQKDAFEAIEA